MRRVAEFIEAALNHFLQEGLLDEWRAIRHDYEQQLEVRVRVGNGWRRFVLTEYELAMGGIDEARRWLERVRQNLQEMRRRQEPQRMWAGIDEAANFDEVFFRNLVPGGIVFHREGRPPTAEEFAQQRAVDALRAKQREEADAKARALFARVVGETAAKELEMGHCLPLLGSVGGRYELRKKASFCVRRPKDGVELCAVVPGVPLWDHLLGIKLVVETDEPRFLRTANASGGGGPFAMQYHAALQAAMYEQEREYMRRMLRERNWLHFEEREYGRTRREAAPSGTTVGGGEGRRREAGAADVGPEHEAGRTPTRPRGSGGAA